MAKSEPRNERRLCDAVARFLAQRQGEAIAQVQELDTVVRNRQAVEAIYSTPSVRFALEHTRVESFPDQIALGKQFVQLLGPLERELGPRLPGWFWVWIPS